MLRIISGSARGRRIQAPPGLHVRPTADRVREALFNLLASRLPDGFEGLRVLDAFAGSGALGLEALSRGAAHVTFVEVLADVVAVLRENIAALGFDASARVVQGASPGAWNGVKSPRFDLVFVDPPYEQALYGPTLEALTEPEVLAPSALVCVEHRTGAPPPRPHRTQTRHGLEELLSRRYGDTTLTLLSSERKMREAIYPGSFDPITHGHIDIIKRGLAVFDKVVVATAVNLRKQPLFSDEERLAMLRETFVDEPRVEIDTFQGLLVDYARKRRIATVLRGLRAVSDFEYEFQMASMNRKLSHEVDYIFMMTSEDQYYVSSSLIREVAANGGSVEGLVPPHVEARLRQRFAASGRTGG